MKFVSVAHGNSEPLLTRQNSPILLLGLCFRSAVGTRTPIILNDNESIIVAVGWLLLPHRRLWEVPGYILGPLANSLSLRVFVIFVISFRKVR